MRVKRWLLLTFLAVGLAGGGVALAAQAVRWQPDLETARRIAAQTNRLVLIHFWADRCPPCKAMEEEVFSRPEVAAALDRTFVPVQINVQHLPKTAQQYGVTRYPTDVVITPSGETVGTSVGALPAPQYLQRLNQIASSARPQPPPGYGRSPGGQAMGATVGQAPAWSQSSGGSAYWADPANRAASTPQQSGPEVGPPSWPELPPWVGQSPAGAGSADRPTFVGREPGPPRPAGPTWPALPAERTTSYLGPSAPEARDSFGPQGGMVQSPSQASALDPPTFQGRALATGRGPAPAGPLGGTGLPQPAREPQVPLGLDGYCPVQLLETDRWVRGDWRFRVIHRGRLYLFAGPEEARRFFADPDRYAPMLSGHDVVLAVDHSQLVPGMRRFGAYYGTVDDRRVFLFASAATFQRFRQDPERYAAAAIEATANATPRAGSPRNDPAATGPQSAVPNWRY